MKNFNKPAPLWFRRLETAVIFLLAGAIPIIGEIRGIGENLRHDLTIVVLPAVILATRTIGLFLGEKEIEE